MTIDPTPEVRAAVHYVGFWARVFASLVDSVLLLILMSVLTMIAFGSQADLAETTPAHFVLSTVVPAMVVLVFWARTQATPGKILVHARIVDADTGAEPRAGQLVLRYLGYFVSLFGLCLGFLWIAFDPRKQGWHDKIAKTVVVRDDREDRKPPEPSTAS